MTQQDNISINKNDFAEWLAELLLPTQDEVEEPSDVVKMIREWNPAEVGDAVASIIAKVCIDDNGKHDMEAAQKFANAKIVKLSAGLRRGSRQDIIRNREKMPMALAGLYETVNIASEILAERDGWQVTSETPETSNPDAPEWEADMAGFDGLAYAYDQSISESFVEMLDDDEMAHHESQDAAFALRLSQRTIRRARLREIEIEINKMNLGWRGAGKRNSGRNKNEVVWRKLLNAIQRRPSQRREVAA